MSEATAPRAQAAAPYIVDSLSIEDGMTMAMWQYPGPWGVADALEAPRPDEGYRAVRDAHGDPIGFCCLGEAARVPGLMGAPNHLDVALGLRPDLVGQGLSREFARTVVDHALEVAEGRWLRCVVAEWNEAGRRAAEHVGFKVSGVHRVPGGGAVGTYMVFVRR